MQRIRGKVARRRPAGTRARIREGKNSTSNKSHLRARTKLSYHSTISYNHRHQNQEVGGTGLESVGWPKLLFFGKSSV